jgi:3-phenylpropionate/cinnamic acid dioxygenase small subunit
MPGALARVIAVVLSPSRGDVLASFFAWVRGPAENGRNWLSNPARTGGVKLGKRCRDRAPYRDYVGKAMTGVEELTVVTTPYEEVQRFYARQMRLLDEGEVTEWAATFTEDGVFAAQAQPAPVRGRAAIEAAAGVSARSLAQDNARHRHWLGMLDIEVRADETIIARSYALVVRIARGGQATIRFSCTCEDVLVRDGERILVRARHVTRDDLER